MKRRASYLTPHDLRRLDWACHPIAKHFGNHPFLVGSVLETDSYRDIDVRLIMSDAALQAMTGGNSERHYLLNAAFTALLESMCRLPKPIDFQFQSESEAAVYAGERNTLGMR